MRFCGRREVRNFLRDGLRLTVPLGRAVVGRYGRGRGRVLFVVSTSVSKRAHIRHRIKRRLDEWARSRRSVVKAIGRDFTVLVSRDSAQLSAHDLRNRAEDMLGRISSLRH